MAITVMTPHVAWLLAAHNALRENFGLHSALALAVADGLYEREKARAALLRTTIKGPLEAVIDHMGSDEPPLVDPDTFSNS